MKIIAGKKLFLTFVTENGSQITVNGGGGEQFTEFPSSNRLSLAMNREPSAVSRQP